MARAKVVHSQDATTIVIRGNKKDPEPTTTVVKFPGGHIEISRTQDGEYWAHLNVDAAANIKDSRIDYDFDGYTKAEVKIPSIPHKKHIVHMAIRVNSPYKATETL